ncbi:hypothetical protein GCM10009721_28030 [Terrabacter tumescens]|uniref:Integral membrane protein n=1 Tax=Terrabacter tumescens TaxID=60443 RepID=A0ABQ2I704_9MICO|nr:hypothetical protein [Terrabacter tumescens]GGM99370.1 hypothetical protein GCM10009721_28030 [Terrabacter tumescens]
MNWGRWLDEYDREARLVPALLTVLPLVLVAIGFGVQDNPVLAGIVAVLLAIGAPMVVAKQVADRGRAVEKTLFAKWGAPPTTLKLIPTPDGQGGELLRQRRGRLERVSGISLPTGPNLSDSTVQTYEAAVRWLIENTRDRAKFPVVWAELKTYGFERNALGLRAVALTTSGCGVLALWAGAVVGSRSGHVSVGTTLALAGVCALVGMWWWLVPSETRVRRAADRYAERVLDATAAMH